ncbi:hypothetical protein [Tepidibacillus marianensis]|uniref:hypothetical protein n=1 Tax=Tepidibacillus marianensis TaxID=3131995 RepID=UPI0030CF050F
MSTVYQIKPTIELCNEMNELLSGYWGNDVWDIRDSFFDNLTPEKWSFSSKTIDFSGFRLPIRNEVKYMYAYKLTEGEIRLISVIGYSPALKRYAEFLDKRYPNIASITEIPYDKALLQWRSFLVDRSMKIRDNGEISTKFYETVFNQLYSFFVNLYDNREEYEKDIWDSRNIPGAKITENISDYYLDFTDIPLEFRELAKRFIKSRTTNNSHSQCSADIMALRLFFKYIHSQEPA